MISNTVLNLLVSESLTLKFLLRFLKLVTIYSTVTKIMTNKNNEYLQSIIYSYDVFPADKYTCFLQK